MNVVHAVRGDDLEVAGAAGGNAKRVRPRAEVPGERRRRAGRAGRRGRRRLLRGGKRAFVGGGCVPVLELPPTVETTGEGCSDFFQTCSV